MYYIAYPLVYIAFEVNNDFVVATSTVEQSFSTMKKLDCARNQKEDE